MMKRRGGSQCVVARHSIASPQASAQRCGLTLPARWRAYHVHSPLWWLCPCSKGRQGVNAEVQLGNLPLCSPAQEPLPFFLPPLYQIMV